jgi:hypothetical protein
MSKRRTAIDKAIERVEDQIRVLAAARSVLLQQRNDDGHAPREPESWTRAERGRRPRTSATVALDEGGKP